MRTFTVRPRIAVATALVLMAATGPAVAADMPFCKEPSINALVNLAARDALDPERLASLVRRFGTSPPDCESPTAFCVGMKAALASVDRAYAAVNADAVDLRAPLAELDAGAREGGPWQLFVMRGDLEFALARRDQDGTRSRQAASDLQRALDAIDQLPLCAAFGEVRPDPDEIRHILARAKQAVILAPDFDPVRTKCDCGGLFRHSIAGVPVGAIPFPALFEGDTAGLTEQGRKSLGLFLDLVRPDKPPRLGILSHAQTPAGEKADLGLSLDRARAVGEFLKERGYDGAVALVPTGRSGPFAADDPTSVSPEEARRLNNRTEIERD